MQFKHRAVIDTIPNYKQGKPAPTSANIVNYKISSNENPYPPLPSVVKAISDKCLATFNRYPDMRGTATVERIAQEFQVQPEEVILGCGSTEVITQLVNLVAGEGDEVIYPWRSFEAYPIIVTNAGATSVQIPNLPDGSHDIDGIINAINERTRLIILNNPNNPTSTALSKTDIERVLSATPKDVLVLLDEAYIQFNTCENTVDGIEVFHKFKNVVVARTFSKAYGLAGLRIGYGIADANIIEGMRKTAIPFGVTDIAQKAAIASMNAYDELDDRVQLLIQERERVCELLYKQGWKFAKPYANFYWIAFGERTDEMQEVFRSKGLSVRAFSNEGIRFTVGEKEANDRVIQILSEYNPADFE